MCPLESLKSAPVNGFPVNCMLAATGARVLLLGRFDLEIDKTCTRLSVCVCVCACVCVCESLSLCLNLSVSVSTVSLSLCPF